MGAIGAFVLVFALALSVTLGLVPLFDYLGRRWGIVASFGGRHVNEADRRRVSKLGGAALFGGFMIAVLVAQLLPVERLDPYEVFRLIGLVVGSTVIFVVGLLDDLFNFPSFPLFLGQFLAAAIAIVFQIFIEMFNNPFTGQQTEAWPHIVTVSLSMFWLVGMMNTANFLDGLDGLAGGVAFIAGTMLFINSAFVVQPAQTSVSLLPLALMGASLGFVLHNFNPARIFLGGGAYFLGYALGTLSIIGGAKMAAILLVMGLPLMDVAWQGMNRIRKGRNPFVGDRGHIHFRLQDMGFSQRQIVLVYYLFCAVFGVLTLVTESRLFKFAALGIMLTLIAVGFILVARSRQAESPSP
jgi:UDP-GlcNAc:undecaprenyl-phosphate GlcNAc-1-phosphate transferase